MTTGRTAYAVVRALGEIATEPHSVPSLAETIDVGPRSARFIVVALLGVGLLEREPDDAFRKRYRIAVRGRELGGHLLLARQTVEPRPPRSGSGNGKRPAGHTVRTAARALRAIAEEPQASPQLAATLGIGDRSARTFINAFARLRLIERVPDDPVRRRHRIAERGRELGALLLLAEQIAPRHERSQFSPRNRRAV